MQNQKSSPTTAAVQLPRSTEIAKLLVNLDEARVGSLNLGNTAKEDGERDIFYGLHVALQGLADMWWLPELIAGHQPPCGDDHPEEVEEQLQ